MDLMGLMDLVCLICLICLMSLVLDVCRLIFCLMCGEFDMMGPVL